MQPVDFFRLADIAVSIAILLYIVKVQHEILQEMIDNQAHIIEKLTNDHDTKD